MIEKGQSAGKQFVYSFTSAKLVLLVSMVLILMALSLMLGIRIERLQSATAAPGGFERAAVAPITLSASAPEAKEPESAHLEEDTIEAIETRAGHAGMGEVVETPSAAAPAETPQNASVPVEAVASAKVAESPVSHAIHEPAPESPQMQVAEQKVSKPQEAVRNTVLPPPTPEKKPVQQNTPQSGHFAIQISSSQDKTQAGRQVEDLKRKGFSAYVEEIDIPKKGRFYRVLIGPYESEAAAAPILAKLKKDASFADSYVRFLP